jgi:hypothetical protein
VGLLIGNRFLVWPEGAAGCKELVRWVLSWLTDVRVIASKSLRDGIALKLKEGLYRQRKE